MRRLFIGALFVALLTSFAACAGRRAYVPPPDDGCQYFSKPCVCWPDHGAPTARWMLDEIVASANWHIANTPSMPGWILLRNKAQWMRNHHCTKYTCGQLYDIVRYCHAEVVAIGTEPAPAPLCAELNHQE